MIIISLGGGGRGVKGVAVGAYIKYLTFGGYRCIEISRSGVLLSMPSLSLHDALIRLNNRFFCVHLLRKCTVGGTLLCAPRGFEIFH